MALSDMSFDSCSRLSIGLCGNLVIKSSDLMYLYISRRENTSIHAPVVPVVIHVISVVGTLSRFTDIKSNIFTNFVA